MIAIIAAMDEEVEALLKIVDGYEQKVLDNVNFYIAKLGDKTIVICKSGIGKVNAAISTTVLFKNFDIEYVINIGSAGSLRKDIRVGSVVIPNVIAYHDSMAPGWPVGFKDGKHTYYPDSNLISKAKVLADDRTYFEPLVSGDSFIYLKSQTDSILENYPESACCEMEGTSIAQTCNFFNIPFIIIRSISDVTIEDGNEISFDEFLPIAAKNSALYCKKFIEYGE